MKRSFLHDIVGSLSLGLTATLAFAGGHQHSPPPAPRPQPAMHQPAPRPERPAPEVQHHPAPGHTTHRPGVVTHTPAVHPGLIKPRPVGGPSNQKLKHRPKNNGGGKPARPSAPGGTTRPRPNKPGRPGKPVITPSIQNKLNGVGPKVGPKTNIALQHLLLGVVLSAEDVVYLKGACQDMNNGLSDDERTTISMCIDAAGDDAVAADDPGTPAEFGLKIDDMREGGAAAQAGLQLGDVILSVNGTRVQSADDLQAALQGLDGDTEVVYISGDSGETLAVDAPVEDGRLGVVEIEVVALDVDNG